MNNFYKISLIGTTQGGRDKEIERLLNSIASSTYKNLEIIFIDQTDDIIIEQLFLKHAKNIKYKLVKSNKVPLSTARNQGLKLCSGNVIGFCDDDAFYAPDFFEKVIQSNIKKETVLSVPVLDFQTMKSYANRVYPKTKKEMGYNQIIKSSLSVGTFIFTHKLDNIYFDERLGVGTLFGGSEETELFFRLKSLGFRVCFQPIFGVYHDNDLYCEGIPEKYRKYAVGYGVVIKKYLVKSRYLLLLEIFRITVKSFFGIVLKKQKKLYMYRLIGLWTGLLKYDL